MQNLKNKYALKIVNQKLKNNVIGSFMNVNVEFNKYILK